MFKNLLEWCMSFYVIDIEFTLKELKLSFSMKGVDLVMILMLFISTGVKGLNLILIPIYLIYSH